MKICLVGAELFHVNRQMDIMKLTVGFCNFANTPKKALKFMESIIAAISCMSRCFLGKVIILTLESHKVILDQSEPKHIP
jgi:hypothetical protein